MLILFTLKSRDMCRNMRLSSGATKFSKVNPLFSIVIRGYLDSYERASAGFTRP